MVATVLALWQKICDRSQVSAALASAWWERIVTYYSEPQRHYHTMTHLEELTALHTQLESSNVFHNPDAVGWTIMFHDIIYDPRRPDNEDKSADLWLEFAAEKAADTGVKDEQLTTTVRQYILQTKHHTSCPADAEKDLRLFLDMDLAILGAPKERYSSYADQIWREYSHYPRAAYCEGRAKILRTFTADANLYKTQEMSALLLPQAWENLQWEIMQLESPPMVTEPVYFADRANVLAFERECRGLRDTLAVSSEHLDHMLAMNTGKVSLAFRHRETKALIAMVIASTADTADDQAESLTALRAPPAEGCDADQHAADRVARVHAIAHADGYSVEHRGESSIHGDHLLIHSLCVAPSLRRRGIMSKLMKDYIEVVQQEMPQIMRVSTVVPDILVPCLSRLGFIDCGPVSRQELVAAAGTPTAPSSRSHQAKPPSSAATVGGELKPSSAATGSRPITVSGDRSPEGTSSALGVDFDRSRSPAMTPTRRSRSPANSPSVASLPLHQMCLPIVPRS